MSAFVAVPTTIASQPSPAVQPAPQGLALKVSAGSLPLGGASHASAAVRVGCLAAAAACGLARWTTRAAARGRAAARRAVAEASTETPKAKAKARPRPKAKAKAKPKKPPVPLVDQATEGIFAPLVLAGHAVVGEPFVTKARGKGIALHSKVITSFCTAFAINNKKRQGFVKTAKKTGHDLGFLIPGGHFGDGLLGPQAMQWYADAGIDRW